MQPDEPRWACFICGCTGRTTITLPSDGSTRQVCATCGSSEFRWTEPPPPEWSEQLRHVLNYGTLPEDA